LKIKPPYTTGTIEEIVKVHAFLELKLLVLTISLILKGKITIFTWQ
jgi:hypothetical protein